MDWIPLNLPKPEDGKKYDIRLHDGTVIAGVEYWDFGAGFDPLPPGEESPSGSRDVRYPLSEVKEYRAHGG
ncbi:MAG: hypothetical protein CVU64_00905 [Deltaproteobacteria bacterium HGW-Deltaproteobacteria-21]|nr:MAG: hypothetical protein CVU64_00905 [Deltaproteobacteria bacterium HGW-Deltaproteobacteria-21]